MFRVPLLVALTLCLAFGGGIWFTLFMLDRANGFGALRIGAWTAYPHRQSASADPYAKAWRARDGRLLYGSAEGLVFRAATDDSGERLTARCRYMVSGQTPAARLWTLYAADEAGHALVPDAGRPGSLNSWIVLRQPDSTFSISVGTRASSGNWLALPATGQFQLVLTLLDTPVAGDTQLLELAMPKIEEAGCDVD